MAKKQPAKKVASKEAPTPSAPQKPRKPKGLVAKRNPLEEKAKDRATAVPLCAVYEHADFKGHNMSAYFDVPYVGDELNDKISSIVVSRGTWQFYIDADYGKPTGAPLGPGSYRWVEDVGI